MKIGVLVVWACALLLLGGCPKKNEGTTPRDRASGGGEGDGSGGSGSRRAPLHIPDELLEHKPCKAYLLALKCFVDKMPNPHRRQGVKTFRSIVRTWLKIPAKNRTGACVRSYRTWMLAMQNDKVAIRCIKEAPPP